MTSESVDIHAEIIAMWLTLARQTKGIVDGSNDWAGEDPDQTGVLMRWADQAEQCFRRAAQAIEAQRAATVKQGAVEDESAVAASDAPNGE